MHGMYLASTLALLLGTVSAWTPDSNLQSFALYAKGTLNQAVQYGRRPTSNGCTVRKASDVRRREWHTLSGSDKKSWIRAVQCLQSKPGLSGDAAPGAQSRYDDFVATHINQTLSIHGTGNFLSWHRYFLWTFEQALRNECGYSGYQPYVDWAKIASDPLSAPVFDGSDTSIGGNGEKRDYAGISIPSPDLPFIKIAPGDGGGCITRGPFVSMSVNLGPLSPVFDDLSPNPQPDGLGLNARCLRRDINKLASATALTDRNITDLIKLNTDIASFQNTMQGDFAAGLIGTHTAGHMMTGGDPGGDIFASPGDVWFWLHHAQIDRVWTIWQNQDLKNRVNAIAGTITLLNNPPSRDTTLEDVIDLGVNADPITIKEVMSPLDGPFCYTYL